MGIVSTSCTSGLSDGHNEGSVIGYYKRVFIRFVLNRTVFNYISTVLSAGVKHKAFCLVFPVTFFFYTICLSKTEFIDYVIRTPSWKI